MAMQIEKAIKDQARLRLAMVGPAGSGKTKSALLMALGLGGGTAKIGVIDTERRSSSLYAKLFEFNMINLTPPYTVAKYREAIATFEDAGFDIIIVDSLSHAWAGEGGLLEKQGQLEASGKYKNSFATWRDITPEHNKLVDEILGSPCHMIVTMRVKTEYVLEVNEKGKQVPRKVGLSPIQRDGLDFEMTVVMDIDDLHYARASKDRTDLFDGWRDQISPKTGEMLRAWLEDGEVMRPAPVATEPPPPARKAAPTDAELLGRILVALRDAATDADVSRILEHQQAQALRARLEGDMATSYDKAALEARNRVTPPPPPMADAAPSWPGPAPEEVEAA